MSGWLRLLRKQDEVGVVESLKGGQAELHTKKEDAKGSSVVEGTVPLTPPLNAPAPSANSE